MKKQMILFAAAGFILAACGENDNLNEADSNNLYAENNNDNTEPGANNEPDAEPDEEEPVQTDDPLGAMESHLEGEGFEVGSHTEKAHEMIGAENGYGIEVNGEEIELYLYDTEAPELEEIETNGQIDMDGTAVNAEANGEIVLAGHDTHSEQEEIVEAFHSFE